MKEIRNLSIGILGGGQLGRMLGQAASPLNVSLHVLEPTPNPPAEFSVQSATNGSFKDYDTVLAFGQKHDVLTVEIEEVNVEALEELEKQGKKVFPRPATLKTIRDKGIQKEFYDKNSIPTMPFSLYENKAEVEKAFSEGKFRLPFVQKSRREGYDGQGVRVLKTEADLENLLDTKCVVEEMCKIQTEISVIVARNESGEVKTWKPVEMVFDPRANLIDFLASPARISEEHATVATQIAQDLAVKLDLVGILAVEMFIDPEGNVVVNEAAPRPHNSGHQTIENCRTSQYTQHLRAILNLPLGSTELTSPSAMLNLTGEPDHSGQAKLEGLEEALKISGVAVHDYGKAETRPFRKMGHVTVLDNSIEGALEKAEQVKQIIKVVSQ